MPRHSLWSAVVACMGVGALVTGFSQPAPAADWQARLLDPAVRTWMGVLTLVAEEGDQEKPRGERADDRGPREGRGERRGRADRGPPRGMPRPPMPPMESQTGPMPGAPAPRIDALAKLDQILSRLGRIESLLAARPMPPRGPGAGPHGPQRSPGRPDFRRPDRDMPPGAEAMRAALMERFTDVRKRFAMLEARIKSLETEVERLKKELDEEDDD